MMDLDERLNLSAPPTTPRTDELRADLTAMVADTEARQRPRPRRRRTAAVALASLLIVGGGVAVAGANGFLAPPFDWNSSTGQDCTSQVQWFTYNEIGGEAMSRDWPDDIQQQTKRAAELFTADYDFSVIDAEQALRDRQAWEIREYEEHDGIEVAPPGTEEEAMVTGVYEIYFADLRAHLDTQGLPMETITPSVSYSCE